MKKAVLAGLITGFLMPLFGLFIGLQVSPILGTLILGPALLPTLLSGTPLGLLPPLVRLLALFMSMLFWAAFFAALHRAVQAWRKTN